MNHIANIKIIFFYSFFIFLFSCSKDKKNNNPILLKRVDFDKNKAIKISKIILDNKIYSWNLWEPVSYEKTVDWTIDPYNNSTWRLYFQSLRMVGILAKAHEYENNPSFVRKGMELIKSWDKKYSYKNWKKDKYAWYDHSVANRVLNLTHFYYEMNDELNQVDKKIIENLINEHGHWLSDDKNYPKGNHGVMVDMALLQMSKLFDFKNSDKWFKKSSNRLKDRIEKEITSEGVCIENSIGYHIFIMDLLKKIINLYDNLNIKGSNYYKVQLKSMNNFLIHVIKPDNTLPALGDTPKSNWKFKAYKKYHDKRFKFIDTNGRMGEKPKETAVVYPISGYAIFRESWGDSTNYKNKVYLIFTNTSKSKVHKQSDNLSFSLYSNEEDLIIDGGHYGYQKNDTMKYLESVFAHNTITIDNTNFDFRKNSLNNSSIYDYKINKNFNYLRASFKPNDSISFKRDIVYLKPNIFILIDQVESKFEIKKFQQLFNLSNSFLAFNKNENTIDLVFEKNNVKIMNLLNNDLKFKYKFKNNLRGIVANSKHKVNKNVQLEFNTVAKNNKGIIVTALYIDNDKFKNKIKLEKIKFHKNGNSFILNWEINNSKNMLKINK